MAGFLSEVKRSEIGRLERADSQGDREVGEIRSHSSGDSKD
jgi:hypothetical protein